MATNQLYAALAAFQQEVKPIYKGTSGYSYKYADWGKILEDVNPLLAKHKLGFSQPLDGTSVKTIVFHTETGESIEGSIEIPQGVQLKGMNDFQVLGSAITYLRRYGLSSMLGLVTDEDADAAGNQIKKGAVNPPKVERWKPADDKPVTDDQKMFIASHLRLLYGVVGKEMIDKWLWDNWHGKPETEAQAQELIDSLNAEINERKEKEKA